MANVTLQNNRLGDLIVGDITIPRDGGTAEIDSDVLKEAKKNKAVEAWFKSGWLITVKADRTASTSSTAAGGNSGGTGGSSSGSGSGSGGNSGGNSSDT